MWNWWKDYIKVWISRPNFIEMLPALVAGEDADFVAYMGRLSNLELKP